MPAQGRSSTPYVSGDRHHVLGQAFPLSTSCRVTSLEHVPASFRATAIPHRPQRLGRARRTQGNAGLVSRTVASGAPRRRGSRSCDGNLGRPAGPGRSHLPGPRAADEQLVLLELAQDLQQELERDLLGCGQVARAFTGSTEPSEGELAPAAPARRSRPRAVTRMAHTLSARQRRKCSRHETHGLRRPKSSSTSSVTGFGLAGQGRTRPRAPRGRGAKLRAIST